MYSENIHFIPILENFCFGWWVTAKRIELLIKYDEILRL